MNVWSFLAVRLLSGPPHSLGKHRALGAKDNTNGVWKMDTHRNNPVQNKQTRKGAGFLTVAPEPAVWMAPPTPPPPPPPPGKSAPWTSGLRGTTRLSQNSPRTAHPLPWLPFRVFLVAVRKTDLKLLSLLTVQTTLPLMMLEAWESHRKAF